MISLHSASIFWKILWDIMWIIIKHHFFGMSSHRKYHLDLINSLRLSVYKNALKIDIKDATYLVPYSNGFLIRKIMPFLSKDLVDNLPGYGEKYGKHCYWLVKQPHREPSDPLIIYCHGGGYYIQTIPSQIESTISIYKLLQTEKQQKTSILFLDYKLASEGYPFPYQLNQLHEAYSMLVKEGNQNIILMGDSAGGHLSIALTRLLKELPEPQYFPSKLLLVSPWVNMCPVPAEFMKGSSWYDNEKYDFITKDNFMSMKNLTYLIGNEYPMSLLCSPGGRFNRSRADWNSIPNFSDYEHDVFLILGEDESFRDDINWWARYALEVDFWSKKYGEPVSNYRKKQYEFHREGVTGLPNVRAYVEPLGVHDTIFYFEQDVAKEITKNEKRGKKLDVSDVDPQKYFGITRIVRFLNEKL